MADPLAISRALPESARLALQHFVDGGTWFDTQAALPRIADGRMRHYHHCIPPLIAAGLVERRGTKQLEGRVVRDDLFWLTYTGKVIQELLG